MLKLKKILIAFCGLALTISATAFSAYAHEIDIKSGNYYGSYDNEGKLTYGTSFVLNISDLATSSSSTGDFTANGMVMIKVPKGVFSAAYLDVTPLDSGNGLCYKSGKNTLKPTYTTQPFNQNATDEFDIILVGWTGNNALYTTNGDICQIDLDYVGEPVAVDMTILTEIDLGAAEPQRTCISICDSSGNVLNKNIAFAENKNTYTLAADSSTVTKTAAGEGSEEDDNTVAFEGFTGTKEDGVTADGSVSVATKKSFTTSEDGTSEILWTVTLNDEDNTKRYHTSTVDFAGGADYTLGMVINGLAESLVKTIEAVLQ